MIPPPLLPSPFFFFPLWPTNACIPTLARALPQTDGVLATASETIEEVEVERNTDEPPFLKGQTSNSLRLSPVKVVKNPDGSMSRAAMTAGVLAKERYVTCARACVRA